MCCIFNYENNNRIINHHYSLRCNGIYRSKMIIRKIKEVIKERNPYYNYKPETVNSISFTITNIDLIDVNNFKVNLDFWNPSTYVVTNFSVSGDSAIIEGVSNGAGFQKVYQETIDRGIKGVEFHFESTESFSSFGEEKEFTYKTIYEDLPEWIECDNCESKYKSEYLGYDDVYEYGSDETLCPCCGTKIYEYELR